MEYSKGRSVGSKPSYPENSNIPRELWDGIAGYIETGYSSSGMHSPAAMYLTGFEPVLSTGFSQLLLEMISSRNIDDSDFYNAANLSRQVFNAIVNKPNYKPTKATALACAIGLQLNINDASILLRSAGYSFSNSNYTDMIVAYSLEHGYYDIIMINQIIYEYNEKPLGSL